MGKLTINNGHVPVRYLCMAIPGRIDLIFCPIRPGAASNSGQVITIFIGAMVTIQKIWLV